MKDLTDLRCGDGAFSTGLDDPMYPACAEHDLDYIRGGTDEERREADENFRKNCEFIAATHGGFRCWLEAKIYPAIVRAFSKAFWKPYSRESDYLEQGKTAEHSAGNTPGRCKPFDAE